ncbi:hypothetical protein KY342_05885 [Candidatus Woesearchaeota archaeon]|nr:hypothetical protein [Candidatus Woesearchaeota archaeon]
MNGEQPQYSLSQDLARTLIPKLLQLIGLGVVFYFAIWLNLYLLNAKDSTKNYTLIITIIILFIAVIIELILIIIKISKNKYLFYQHKLEFKDQSIPFVNVTNVYLQKNLLDKIFNTGTIILYPNFKIEKISNVNQVFYYVQKLVQITKQKASS